MQTERVVAKDNTVSIGNRLWQIDQTRFRGTLAGSTVTIHQHLDVSVSIRYGPHVVGRYDSRGQKLVSPTQEKRRGKGPTAPTTTAVISPAKAKAKAKAKPKTKARAA